MRLRLLVGRERVCRLGESESCSESAWGEVVGADLLFVELAFCMDKAVWGWVLSSDDAGAERVLEA